MVCDNTFGQERVQTAREAPSDMEGPRSSKQVMSATGQQVSGRITLCLDATARAGHSLLVKVWSRSMVKPENQLRAWGLRCKSPGYTGQDWTQLQCSHPDQSWDPQIKSYAGEKKGEWLLSLPSGLKDLVWAQHLLKLTLIPECQTLGQRGACFSEQRAEFCTAVSGLPLVHTDLHSCHHLPLNAPTPPLPQMWSEGQRPLGWSPKGFLDPELSAQGRVLLHFVCSINYSLHGGNYNKIQLW